ncbi:MAG: secretion protein HlyD, partial [Betaproteobacteria bacterium]|nr:secretion protein HlyD [Betaproteobacteria bacterium]
GDKVRIACEGCEPVGAVVSYVAPQAEYTPPVIYSRETRSKLVFLVEARPVPADATRLKPGQPVDVTVSPS